AGQVQVRHRPRPQDAQRVEPLGGTIDQPVGLQRRGRHEKDPLPRDPCGDVRGDLVVSFAQGLLLRALAVARDRRTSYPTCFESSRDASYNLDVSETSIAR